MNSKQFLPTSTLVPQYSGILCTYLPPTAKLLLSLAMALGNFCVFYRGIIIIKSPTVNKSRNKENDISDLSL